jgi:hypothetical protein
MAGAVGMHHNLAHALCSVRQLRPGFFSMMRHSISGVAWSAAGRACRRSPPARRCAPKLLGERVAHPHHHAAFDLSLDAIGIDGRPTSCAATTFSLFLFIENHNLGRVSVGNMAHAIRLVDVMGSVTQSYSP